MNRLIALGATAALAALAACSDTTSPAASGVTGVAPTVRGQVVASNSCAPCHGFDLRGRTPAPSLAATANYTWTQFAVLLNTGVTNTGRQALAAMSVSSHAGISDSDRHAVFEYLKQYPW